MQILLKQNELEIAIRDYVLKMGISRPVEDINFTVTRTPTTNISAEIMMDEPVLGINAPEAAAPRVTTVTEKDSEPAANESAPAKVTTAPKASAPAPKKAEPEPAEEAGQEEDIVGELAKSAQANIDTDTDGEVAPSPKKSLFA